MRPDWLPTTDVASPAMASRLTSENSPSRKRRYDESPRLRLVRSSDARVCAIPPDAAACGNAVIRRGDSPHTRRAYTADLERFFGWLAGHGIEWTTASADDLDAYRDDLRARLARATANRRLVVVRLLYREARRRRVVDQDPADGLRSLRGRDERDGGALTAEEARAVLNALQSEVKRPKTRIRALRDRAILALLLGCGLRRAELASLRRASLQLVRGHRVVVVEGKGRVRRTAKLSKTIAEAVEAWLEASAEPSAPLRDAPMFVEISRGGRLGRHPLSDRAVYDVVAHRLTAAGAPRLGPHALRATFVTLALEGGAPLQLVQRAAGHADPRTTERYWRRAVSLEDHAADYVGL